MFQLQYQTIFKYLMIAILLFAILYYLPSNKLDTDTIVKTTLVVLLLLFIFENFVFTNQENMYNMPNMPTNITTNMTPMEYANELDRKDRIMAGFNPDNIPGYYLVNNGDFSEDGLDYNKAQQLIVDSKCRHLYSQKNFNIIYTPQLYIGKNRGFLNWNKIYD
jgi:hypothetical protein